MSRHTTFWRDFAGKIGPPTFSGTLVACLLQRMAEPLHLALLAAGLVLIWIGHRSEYHAGTASRGR